MEQLVDKIERMGQEGISAWSDAAVDAWHHKGETLGAIGTSMATGAAIGYLGRNCSAGLVFGEALAAESTITLAKELTDNCIDSWKQTGNVHHRGTAKAVFDWAVLTGIGAGVAELTRCGFRTKETEVISSKHASKIGNNLTVPNPYLDEVKLSTQVSRIEHNVYAPQIEIGEPGWEDSFRDYRALRTDLKLKYAWAIPSQEALNEIKAFSHNGVVEIGAGTGYWASLLRQMNVDIMAFDAHPVESGTNNFHPPDGAKSFTKIEQGDESIAALHPERALMLCWPPYKDPMAYRSLKQYAGNRLIYIGEYDGASGDQSYFDLLSKKWDLVKTVPIPRWDNHFDELYLYERKKS